VLRFRRMPKDELHELRAVLREAVAATRRPYREIEDQLGIGHGTLKRILAGDFEIRAYHLTQLARLLRVHPKEFFELAFPDWPAQHRLSDWVTPDRRKALPRQTHFPDNTAELAELIRDLIRQELSASARKTPSPAG
jgi:hypothetical protein